VHRRTLLRIAQKLPGRRPGLPRLPHALPIDLARVAQWFHACSDTTRLSILELLAQRDRCAGELQQILDATHSGVSFHLKVLTSSGLVREQRVGRWKYFSLRPETLEHMVAFTQIVMPYRHVGLCPLSCCQ
jgi:ArsR family transcriptional regulator